MIVIKFLLIFLPWGLRRFLLIKLFKYKIAPTAHIGLSFIYPKELIMDDYSIIRNFTVAIHLDKLHIGEYSSIGRGNWITGFPVSIGSLHFSHDNTRKSELLIGKNTAITRNHHIDCTNIIKIGNYVTVAGYRTQMLTHSIDIYRNIQDSHPISIGDYCFVSTGCILLGGSSLPPYSVLAAGAVLNKNYSADCSWKIFGGIPAKPIKDIDKKAKYFCRSTKDVY